MTAIDTRQCETCAQPLEPGRHTRTRFCYPCGHARELANQDRQTLRRRRLRLENETLRGILRTLQAAVYTYNESIEPAEGPVTRTPAEHALVMALLASHIDGDDVDEILDELELDE